MKDLVGRQAFDLIDGLDAKKLKLSDEDKSLVVALARNIINRWVERAEQGPNGTAKTFDAIYQSDHVRALGAIVAIIELVHSIGKGGTLPAEYAGIVKVKSR